MIKNLLTAALLICAQVNEKQGQPQPPAAEALPRCVMKMNVTNGEKEFIKISWSKAENTKSYRIYRSNFRSRDFNIIAETESLEYIDTEALPGMVYWYRVEPVFSTGPDVLTSPPLPDLFINEKDYIRKPAVQPGPLFTLDELEAMYRAGQKAEFMVKLQEPEGNNYSGYRYPPVPPSENLDELINRADSSPAGGQYPADDETREFLKTYYMNSIQLNMLLSAAKPYLSAGDIKLFSGFQECGFDRNSNRLKFIGRDYAYMAFMRSVKMNNLNRKSPDRKLGTALLENAEIYCVFTGHASYIDRAGVTRVMPCYEAAGLTTRAEKFQKNWRKRTIIAPSGNTDLIKRLVKIAGLKYIP